jgi:NAD+ synthetase
MAPLVHIAIAQVQPRKADRAANLARLARIIAQLAKAEPRPQVLVLPESALTGYFLEGGVRDNAVTGGQLALDLARAHREAAVGDFPLDIVIGFYEIWRNKLYNSVMYVSLGDPTGAPRVHHVHRKLFLPTYGLFDEERFVERGSELRAFDTPWGRAAMLVCEDAWHSLTGTIAALDGAQVIFVVAAPPARGIWPRNDGVDGPASVDRWNRLMRDMAEEHGVYVALSALAGSEGGKLFPGGSLLAGPHGEIRGQAPVWDEAVLTATIDLADVTRARADMPLIADLETMMPHLGRSLMAIRRGTKAAPELDWPAQEDSTEPPVAVGTQPPQRGGERANGQQLPVVAAASGRELPPTPLAINAQLTEDWLVRFIRDEMQRRGFTCAVIGISGGVDSAVTAYLAERALGPKNVFGVRLPYRTSSRESLEHAQLVIDALGVQSRTIDISAAVDGYLDQEPDADAGRRGNVMARMRMITLFDLAAKHRGIPLGTGNKTERLFGYFTWHADDSPPINPLGDLFKTQVWELARHLGVPEVIVGKPPTADLVVGQTDESDFGISYAAADEILNWMLSGYAAQELVARGFDADQVELVRRRVESTHWKRRLPTVAMVSPTAIGESYLRPVDY